MEATQKSDFRFLSSHQYCVFWQRGCGGPAMNVYETEQAILIVTELAGVAPDTLKIDVETNLVRVQGMRQVSPPEGLHRIHRLEIASGPFQFAVQINVSVDPSQASSHYQNGLLEIVLPLLHHNEQRVVVNVTEGETR